MTLRPRRGSLRRRPGRSDTFASLKLDQFSDNGVAAMASAQRRLSTILHAYLAGFVRLVENEEDLTFQRLRSVRAEVWRPAIESAGGALVHRHDIFGDGVNLTERIQTMAELGGIAVSRAIRDVAEPIGNYSYVDGGEQRAKHVSCPIQIFSVRARHSDTTLTSPIRPVRGTLRFRGADQSGRKFGFDLEVEGLRQHQQSVVIGRDSSQCDVVLSHATVSRRHALLNVAADNKLQVGR